MRPKKQFPPDTVDALKTLLSGVPARAERSRIQAVLIRALIPEARASQIAAITGLSPNYVAKLHSQFLRRGTAVLVNLPERGGHRHGVLTEKGRAHRERIKKRAAKNALLEKYLREGKTRVFALTKIELEDKLGHPTDDAHVLHTLKERGFQKAPGFA